MKDLDTREWLLTNGLGGLASGTVCDARTRTYHGWLVAALEPPGRRMLLLSHLDASLEVAGEIWALSTNFWNGGKKIDPVGYQFLQSFTLEPVPQWVWQERSWQLARRLVMPYGWGENTATQPGQCRWDNRILIQYRYEGTENATLRLRPLIADRDFHHQQSAEEDLRFSQLVGEGRLCLQGLRPDYVGMPWQLRWSVGKYQPEGVWYWNYYYVEENRRGLGDREDLYSPGYLSVPLQPGEAVTLEARVGWPDLSVAELNGESFEQAVQAERERQQQLLARVPTTPKPGRERLWQQLVRAADQFIVHRASINSPTVIAGYPWFNDWGRDTLIALPGLTLTTGRFAEARGLLQTFGRYCRRGVIPNTFPDAEAEPIYNSIDASLWWIETLGLYLETTQDWEFLREQYPTVRNIYKAYTAGTLYQISVDAADGLLTWDAPEVAITWMDVVLDGEPITPRRGKPIEINALWYSALCWISQWTQILMVGEGTTVDRWNNQAQHYAQQAQRVKASLQKFWHPEQHYFFDAIEPDDRRDARIRPNAMIALSLHHCGFPEEQACRALAVARDRLLTPYGLRSLDANDPDYIGSYSGDRIHRDSAYHQGTVWSWLIGPFIRAWRRFYPSQPLPFEEQALLAHIEEQACIGSISEIFDGDSPHSPQGAIAQAWSVAELLRHFSEF